MTIFHPQMTTLEDDIMKVTMKQSRNSPTIIFCSGKGHRICFSVGEIGIFLIVLVLVVAAIGVSAGYIIRSGRESVISDVPVIAQSIDTASEESKPPVAAVQVSAHTDISYQEILPASVPTNESTPVEESPEDHSSEESSYEDGISTADESSAVYTPRTVTVDSGYIEYDIKLSPELQKITYNLSQEYGIRYSLILALMFRESGYNVDAYNVNSNGTADHGLMQINDCNAKLMNSHGINWDIPEENIEGGCIILKYFLDQNDWDENKALMAYQYGQSGMLKKYEQGIYTSKALDRLYWAENELLTNGGI